VEGRVVEEPRRRVGADGVAGGGGVREGGHAMRCRCGRASVGK
jgi:hypothetical protein